MRAKETWSPFDHKGRLRIVLHTDPWWKRLRAKLRREPIWHQVGAMVEPPKTTEGQ